MGRYAPHFVMNIQQRLIDVNYSTGQNKKLGICIHTMVGTLASTDAHFRDDASNVSSHYGLSLDGETTYQWVLEDHIAWTQGIVDNPTSSLVKELGGNPNSYLVSIECADEKDPYNADRSKQYSTLAKLVADIAKRNNIPLDRKHILGHNEIYSKKGCPGNLDINKVVELAKQVENGREVILEADLPTWFEDEFKLKTFSWYNKYWTLKEFVINAISTHFDVLLLRNKNNVLTEDLKTSLTLIKENENLLKELIDKNDNLSKDKEGLVQINLQLEVDLKRLRDKRFTLNEIIGLFINWLRTGGDSVE